MSGHRATAGWSNYLPAAEEFDTGALPSFAAKMTKAQCLEATRKDEVSSRRPRAAAKEPTVPYLTSAPPRRRARGRNVESSQLPAGDRHQGETRPRGPYVAPGGHEGWAPLVPGASDPGDSRTYSKLTTSTASHAFKVATLMR